jgi:hypothetical protein
MTTNPVLTARLHQCLPPGSITQTVPRHGAVAVPARLVRAGRSHARAGSRPPTGHLPSFAVDASRHRLQRPRLGRTRGHARASPAGPRGWTRVWRKGATLPPSVLSAALTAAPHRRQAPGCPAAPRGEHERRGSWTVWRRPESSGSGLGRPASYAIRRVKTARRGRRARPALDRPSAASDSGRHRTAILDASVPRFGSRPRTGLLTPLSASRAMRG